MRKSRVEAAKTRERIVAAAAAEFAPEDLDKLAKAMTLAHSSLSPVALLLQRDLMWDEPR